MNNYIILNGINSNTITGLIIQSLPPISKPLMRTNIETIDGKDGDIITKLGYSAYDKEISIGLSYNYNVDDVIEFFNSEGTVIFSNEPTKYYKYTILDQIDFNRLIRFKTATVRMHVQPFKYSTTEEDIEENATETDNEGVNFTLENTENGAGFIDLKIKGDTSQDGTPTPSTPVDVDVVTGDNTVTLCGKQLFDKDNEQWTSAYISGSSATKLNPSAYNRTLYIKCLPNTTYTIQKMVSITSSKFFIASSVDVPNIDVNIYNVLNAGDTSTSATYTTSNNAKYLLVTYMQTNATSTTVEEMLDSIQIEKGNQASPYEDYHGQSYTLSLGDIELCKMGNYQDYIYPANNTWYIHKKVAKVVLNGSESTWVENGATKGLFQVTLTNVYANNNTINALSNLLIGNTGTNITQATTYTDNSIATFNSNRLFFRINDYKENLAGLKTYLASNNLIAYYVLATATDTEITDATLLSQLNALKGATTYEGQTNIITAGDLQPIIYVKTYAMDNPSYTVTNSGNYFAKPVMTIYGIGTVGIYLDGVQVLSLNLNENQTDHITIDVPNMNAYTDTINTLRNRAVTGDYNNLKFNVGDNELSFSGTIQGFIIQNYSRWL